MEQAVQSFSSELSLKLDVLTGDYKKDKETFIGIYVSVTDQSECTSTDM